MIPDDVDELIDGLPQHTRNKVLSAFDQEEEPEYCALSDRQRTVWWVLFLVAVPTAFGGAAWAIVHGATLLRLPEAIGMLLVTNVPLGVLFVWRFVTVREPNPEEGEEDE